MYVLDAVGKVKMSEDLNQKIKIDTPLIECIDNKNVHTIKVKTYKGKEIEDKKRIKGNGFARRRNYRPFVSNNPRKRSACPECNSVSLQKRISTRNYVCDRCGWRGTGVVKVMY